LMLAGLRSRYRFPAHARLRCPRSASRSAMLRREDRAARDPLREIHPDHLHDERVYAARLFEAVNLRDRSAVQRRERVLR
jgi:hypothetical protein